MNLPLPLVMAAAAGEAEALSEVVRVLHRPLYNLALRMLIQHQDAEDATQEALLRIITHLGSFRGDSRFSTWAWTLATRVVLEHLRARGSVTLSIEDFEADLADGRDDDARIEDQVLLRQVKLGCGRAMLSCLDDELRIAYTLGEILEVPGPQAARALEISAPAFRKRLSRARKLVHEHLHRVCGVVDESAPCRCAKRVRPAQRMGRLMNRDAEGDLEVESLVRRLCSVDETRRATEFYRADPMVFSAELVHRVRGLLGIG